GYSLRATVVGVDRVARTIFDRLNPVRAEPELQTQALVLVALVRVLEHRRHRQRDDFRDAIRQRALQVLGERHERHQRVGLVVGALESLAEIPEPLDARREHLRDVRRQLVVFETGYQGGHCQVSSLKSEVSSLKSRSSRPTTSNFRLQTSNFKAPTLP